MSDRVYTLRRGLEAFLRAEAAAAVAELSGESAVGLARSLVSRFAMLGSDESYEAAGALTPYTAVEAREAQAMRAHMRRFRQLVQRARVRELRASVFLDAAPSLAGRSVVEVLAALARGERVPGVVARLEELAEPAAAELSDRIRSAPAPEPGDTLATAAQWLDDTQDIFEAARDYALPDAREPGPLLLALMASPFSPRGRLQRAAARFEPLGLAPALRRVRLSPARRDALMGMGSIVTNPPSELRLAPPPLELGMISELDAAHAVGRVLCGLWVSPALPAALRWPAEPTVSEAMGGLSMQLLAVPEGLDACVGASERERQTRRVGGALLAGVRLSAGWARWVIQGRDLVSAPDAWRKALGVALSPALALVLTPEPRRALDLFRGSVDALALWVALRERFDEDWYLNPKAADSLRGAAERGGGLSSAEWLTELGGRPRDALARAHELFPS